MDLKNKHILFYWYISIKELAKENKSSSLVYENLIFQK